MKRLLIVLAAVGALVALFLALDLGRFVSPDLLYENRRALKEFVAARPALAMVLYGLAYIAVAAFSIPAGLLMTLTGGFLFGTWVGGALALGSAVAGATLVFLATRTALAAPLRRMAGRRLRRLEDGFRRDAFNYMLVLRLMPIVPFWLTNLAPGLLGVSLRHFVLGSLLGMIPGTFIYASVGDGAGALLDRGEEPDLGVIFTPDVLLPLVGLALLALVPVVWRRLRARSPAPVLPDPRDAA